LLKAGFFFVVAPAPLQFFILAGPTASGKSDFALRLATQLRTEIIGADAFQIYAGLDILSGKPSPQSRELVPHHLIGILPLTENCDAARYAEIASERIKLLNARGIRPLVVGGSGFYLKALTHPLPALPSADPAIRTEFGSRSMASLLAELEMQDPICFQQIDRHNRRRVERALEVCRLTGQPFSTFRSDPQREAAAPALVLERSRNELYERIDRRVETMLVEGAIAEVRQITGISQTAAQMIGFTEIRQYLAGHYSLTACAQAIQFATRRYAKRQLTWFRRQNYLPFPASRGPEEAAVILRDWGTGQSLRSMGPR
jgi:tRNA dimethylallyltransferase